MTRTLTHWIRAWSAGASTSDAIPDSSEYSCDSSLVAPTKRQITVLSTYGVHLLNNSQPDYAVAYVRTLRRLINHMSKVEEEIFAFLRHSFHVGAHALKPEFEKLLNKLKKYEDNPLERRAFAYLDVISWLESKIHNVNVQDVVRERYFKRRK